MEEREREEFEVGSKQDTCKAPPEPPILKGKAKPPSGSGSNPIKELHQKCLQQQRQIMKGHEKAMEKLTQKQLKLLGNKKLRAKERKLFSAEEGVIH